MTVTSRGAARRGQSPSAPAREAVAQVATGLLVAAAVLVLALLPLDVIFGGHGVLMTAGAVVVVVTVATAGLAVAAVLARLSREWDERRAVVLFFVVGLVTGGAWSAWVVLSLLHGGTGVLAALVAFLAVASGVAAGVARFAAPRLVGNVRALVALGVFVALFVVLGIVRLVAG